MYRPKAIVILAIAFHFTILIGGMLRVDLKNRKAIGYQRLYSRITGAGGSFGFFSPNVPREIDVQFTIEDAKGAESSVWLRQLASNEVNARLGNMIYLLEKSYAKDRVMRSVAASLTAWMYRARPDSKTITLNAFFYDFPTMKEFREGKRMEKAKVYSAKFGRRLE